MRKVSKTHSLSAMALTTLLILFSLSALSQESILSASNNATGDGGTVSYSVGQAAFNTFIASTGAITEGVQQPYEILFMTGLDDENQLALHGIVYPNPATSELKLKIDLPSFSQLYYRLSNGDGLKISHGKIDAEETVIPVESLSSGVYLLTVMENEKILSTWKVIKK
jgi:hypothetical protein